MILIIIITIILKRYLSSDNNPDTLTKKLMNYISNGDMNGKEGSKNSNYDTIGKDSNNYGSYNPKGKGNSSGKSNSNNSHKNQNNQYNNNQYNNNNDVNLTIGNRDILNTSDSVSTIIEKETSERINKLIRFAVDYCRASPNIMLKNKSLLNIGWRGQKFNYDVDFEIVGFKGEKQNVKK